MKLSVDVSKEEKALLEHYASERGLTVEELMRKYVDTLARLARTDIHPEVKKVSGILPTNEPINVREEYADYMTKKHK